MCVYVFSNFVSVCVCEWGGGLGVCGSGSVCFVHLRRLRIQASSRGLALPFQCDDE